MIQIIVLEMQYQVIYNQSNLSFQPYFEEFRSEIEMKIRNLNRRERMKMGEKQECKSAGG